MRASFWIFTVASGLIGLGGLVPTLAQTDSGLTPTLAPPTSAPRGAPPPNTQAMSLGPAPSGLSGSSASSMPRAADPTADLQQQALKLCNEKRYDDALVPLNQALAAQPKSLVVLNLRGFVYAKKKQWDLAQADYQTILRIDPKQAMATFNLSELQFQQKLYDRARGGFDSVKSDPDLGDLASYKVFLSDLYAGHKQVAQDELDAFNAAGENPSYYFSNAAWELYHQHPDAARPWLASAQRIYYPAKVANYSSTLFDLGYLPLAPDANSTASTPGSTSSAPPTP